MTMAQSNAPVFGITGWKNSGKTGLVVRLVTHFSAQGLRVATIKHAHHAADMDQPGTDTFRHRAAGAGQVVLASPRRVCMIQEVPADTHEPTLPELLQRLQPADLALVEGFKSSAHPKIEAHRHATGQSLIAMSDPSIRAVASDTDLELDRPLFDLDDTAAIAGFIAQELDL